jgi:Fe-S cluster assembly ATP-binding protein
MRTLEIQDLHVAVGGKEILNGITLRINTGEVHALMGPNGSGKSTLAAVLMGHPKYIITAGRILLDGGDITKLAPDERAKRGLFLSFQYPVAIPGVTVESMLRTAYSRLSAKQLSVAEFHRLLLGRMEALRIDAAFARRYLNEGFSGGEKKRTEVLQMEVLDPAFAVLDETDSGLDVDALKVVADGINRRKDSAHGTLIITHFSRILRHVQPDHVHIMIGGRIVKSGDASLAYEIEAQGYERHKSV